MIQGGVVYDVRVYIMTISRIGLACKPREAFALTKKTDPRRGRMFGIYMTMSKFVNNTDRMRGLQKIYMQALRRVSGSVRYSWYDGQVYLIWVAKRWRQRII